MEHVHTANCPAGKAWTEHEDLSRQLADLEAQVLDPYIAQTSAIASRIEEVASRIIELGREEHSCMCGSGDHFI